MQLSKSTFELNIIPTDESYRYRAIMGENNISLRFELPEHIDIPLGASTMFEGFEYTLERPAIITKKHSRSFEYSCILESPISRLVKYKFRNTIDKHLKFSYTAKPIEHLTMLVVNLNEREGDVWSIGECIDLPEKYIGYNHTNCRDALQMMAETFKTEWEIVGKTIHLRKVEHNFLTPLYLSYGQGNGFKPGVGRTNFEDHVPIEILYVQGGNRNIDFTKYPSKELLLPKLQTIKFDGAKFEDEAGFVLANSRQYISDAEGIFIKRNDKALQYYNEDSLDATDVYPKRVGEVTEITIIDEATHIYEFTDTTIPTDLNFNNFIIPGETMTVIFQMGMLAAREFEVTSYNHTLRKFRLKPAFQDGFEMPSAEYPINLGDTYAVFNIQLPDAYISDNTSKTGASWDMFRQAVQYLYINEDQKFSFQGELDGIWAKTDWLNIGGKIKLGGFISFSDPQFQQENVLVRTIGIKDYINNPHSPILELSNGTVTSGLSTTIKKYNATEIKIEESKNEILKYSKRSFQGSVETFDMLSAAMLAFTDAIGPAAVHTMDVLVGDESLQYRFVNNKTNPSIVAHNVTFDINTMILTIPSGIIQHMTLGVGSISSVRPVSEYKFWDIEAFTSPSLSNTNKPYYVYIKADKTSQSATFVISEVAIELESVSGYYHFLLGTLNSQTDGAREFSEMYGFTEILPGRITTEKIVSSDGQNYMDFTNNAFRIGNNSVEVSFNKNNDGQLLVKGSILQTPSGQNIVLGNYRGVYNSGATYNEGDEVSYTSSSITSTYRYINATATSGNVPTNTSYWSMTASGGGVSTGTQGDIGPMVIYRGVYDGANPYYGISTRRDVVKYNNVYYIAKIGAGSAFSGTLPTSTTKWETFGGQFESVATNLLLAEGANIADWIISNGQIRSQAETTDNTPRAKLNGTDGKIEFASDVSRYTEANGSENIKQTIKIDSTNGILESRTSDNEVSSMTSQGIFSNKAGTEALPSSFGKSLKGSIVGLGFGNMDKTAWGSDYGIAGVVGIAKNTSTNPAPAFGGWFKDLFAMGLTMSSRVIVGNDFPTESDTIITSLATGISIITLPEVQSEGNIKIIKNINTGSVRVYPSPDQRLFDNSTLDTYIEVVNGQMLILYSAKLNVSGTNRMCWIATKI